MSTSEIFLGLIALGVLAIGAGQVAVALVAARAVRRLGDTVTRLEHDVRPVITNLQALSVDAARAAASTSAGVARAEQLLNTTARRVEQTMDNVQHSLLRPARDGVAVVQGIKAAFGAFRGARGRAPSRRGGPSPVPVAVPDPGNDDEPASFIG